MTTLQSALVLALLALLTGSWWLHRRPTRDRAAHPAPSDRVDTVIGWPAQATRVLSAHERNAFGTLTRALPDHMVLAQVPLSRFLSVPKRNSYADWLRRVGYQCVDFVVCDKAAQVIAIVELQPDGPPSERAKKRMKRITRTLESAAIPLLVWRADALPSTAAARAAILPETTPSAIAKMTSQRRPAPAFTTPAAAFNPFEDAGRDSTQDERIELLEPPPSTWFDEFDSQPAPLAKA